MSLKAKIEAVIYAAEEPVTLAQLVGLLGQEAQAELDRAVSAQQSLLLDENETELAGKPEDITKSVAETTAEPELVSTVVEYIVPPVAESASEAVDRGETPAAAEPTQAAAELAAANAAAESAAATRAERTRATKLRAHFRTLLDELVAEYATSERGLEIREIAGGFKFTTKPEYHDAVRGFVKSLKPPLKLTLQALETLAVVAYKQPVTAPEISEIRGVDSGGVLGSLMARKLITTAGRKQVIGRPILYKTTREFLLKFGLKDVSELPSIEEFEKMAGQLAEQEEIALPEHETRESGSDSPDSDNPSSSKSDSAESSGEQPPAPDPAYTPPVENAPAAIPANENASVGNDPEIAEETPPTSVES
jgi:segregation and condensation protein B